MNDEFDLSALFAARQPQRKKRGGLAGIWDRNKHIIRPVAAGLAGLATGGLMAPALLGAAMRGLDREGKGGVGFNAGQGLTGAAEGALAGSAGRGLGNLFRGGAQAAASQAAGQAVPSAVPLPDASAVQQVGAAGPATAVRQGMGGLRGVLGSTGRFIQANPTAVGMGLQAGSNILGMQTERRLREREDEERRRQAQNLAAFALPLYFENQRGMP